MQKISLYASTAVLPRLNWNNMQCRIFTLPVSIFETNSHEKNKLLSRKIMVSYETHAIQKCKVFIFLFFLFGKKIQKSKYLTEPRLGSVIYVQCRELLLTPKILF